MRRALFGLLAMVLALPTALEAQGWSYRVTEDEMTGGTTRMATIQSTNTVTFDFPYGSAQRGTLIVRTHPSYGKNIIFRIERGQMPCFQGCIVNVRFDEDDPRQWRANPASSGDATLLFLRNHDRFVARLREASVVRIQPEVYREGRPVFRFNVQGFDHERYAGQ